MRNRKRERRVLRCLTVGESASGKGTQRCKRRSGPKRYEPKAKAEGNRKCEPGKPGKPRNGKEHKASEEQAEIRERRESEETGWTQEREAKAEGSGVKRGGRETEGSAVSKGSGSESRGLEVPDGGRKHIGRRNAEK